MIKRIFKKKLLPIPPLYNRENFIEVWKDIVGTFKMCDVKNKLIISSIDFVDKKTHFFKSWQDPDEMLLDVVLRSFSAPLYFGLMPDCKTKRVYGDGGMGGDNMPITETLLESLNLDWNWKKEQMKFIIVGTGFANQTESFEKLKKAGLLWQMKEYIQPMNGGFARMTSRQRQIGQLMFLCKKFPNLHFDYYDIEIPKSLDKMDNVKAINEYIRYGTLAAQKPLLSV
jgi:patatin-like phospholipase/acyl hydrolase